MTRIFFGALLLALGVWFSCAGVKAEEGGFTPPANAPVVPWTRFSIQYAVRDLGGGGPKTIEFYITTNGGKTWNRYGEDPDAQSPMVIQVAGEGIYGFTTVAMDRFGYRERIPAPGSRPEIFVIVDRTPPQAKWISPKESLLPPPEGISLAWTSSDAYPHPQPVSLYYSTDGGQRWLPLRENLPAEGQFLWRPPEDIKGEITLQLIARDRAGNRRIVRSPATILFDRIPPVAEILGPSFARPGEVTLNYRASDNEGGTGLARIALYTTRDGGRTWTFAGEDSDLQSPLTVTVQGESPVGLMLVPFDKAGNHPPLPMEGTLPPFTLTLDTSPPNVTLDPSFLGSQKVIRAGTPVTIRFSATDPNIRERSAAIEFSSDNGATWKLLAEGLPLNEPYLWNVPNEASRSCRIRVTARDLLGQVGEAVSPTFAIDVRPSATAIREVRPLPREAPPPPTPSTAKVGEIEPPIDPKELMERSSIPAERKKVARPTREVLPAEGAPQVAGVALEGIAPQPSPESAPGEPKRSLFGGSGRDLDTMAWGTKEEPAGTAVPSVPAPLDLPPPTPVQPSQTTAPSRTADIDVTRAEVPIPPVAVPPSPAEPVPARPTEPIPSAPPETQKKEELALRPTPTPLPGPQPTPPSSELPSSPPAKKETSEATPTSSNAAANAMTAAQRAIHAGDLQAAIAHCEKAIELEPVHADAHALLASILIEMRQFDRAVTYAQKAVTFNSREPAFRQVLGDAYMGLARSHQATLDANPTMGDIQRQTLIEQRDHALKQAEAAYRFLSNMPDQQKIGFEKLGDYYYYRCKTEANPEPMLREAIASYNRAFSIGEGTYKEAFQIGVCHYRLREYDRAQRWLEEAVVLAPPGQSPKEAFFYLGMIHQNAGRLADAVKYWEHAAKAYPPGSPFQQQAEKAAKACREQMGR